MKQAFRVVTRSEKNPYGENGLKKEWNVARMELKGRMAVRSEKVGRFHNPPITGNSEKNSDRQERDRLRVLASQMAANTMGP